MEIQIGVGGLIISGCAHPTYRSTNQEINKDLSLYIRDLTRRIFDPQTFSIQLLGFLGLYTLHSSSTKVVICIGIHQVKVRFAYYKAPLINKMSTLYSDLVVVI